MSLQEIEAAIERPPSEKFSELMMWLGEFSKDAWDRQMDEDLDTRRLDGLLERAHKEFQAALSRPM